MCGAADVVVTVVVPVSTEHPAFVIVTTAIIPRVDDVTELMQCLRSACLDIRGTCDVYRSHGHGGQ
jgi:protein subunit release factor A